MLVAALWSCRSDLFAPSEPLTDPDPLTIHHGPASLWFVCGPQTLGSLFGGHRRRRDLGKILACQLKDNAPQQMSPVSMTDRFRAAEYLLSIHC